MLLDDHGTGSAVRLMRTCNRHKLPIMTTQTKILFLTANPSDTAELLLGEEIRLISARIRRGEYRKLFDIRSAPAIRATDLPFELMDQTPHIVHFSGHGTDKGELCFVRDGDLQTVAIPAPTLARVFRQFRDSVKCVVLNACFSAIQAEAIAESIPCVVGMTRAVPDATAIAFSAGFYEALAFGKSVADAFELGLTQVELTDPRLIGTSDIPKLVVRPGEDARQIRFAAATPTEAKVADKAPSVQPAGIQTQRIGKIQIGGGTNSMVIGQYGNTSGNSEQEVDDIAVDGKDNRLVIEQKK